MQNDVSCPSHGGGAGEQQALPRQNPYIEPHRRNMTLAISRPRLPTPVFQSEDDTVCNNLPSEDAHRHHREGPAEEVLPLQH